LAKVVRAFGTDVETALKLGPIKHRLAFRTLAPQAFRNAALGTALGADPRGQKILEPTH